MTIIQDLLVKPGGSTPWANAHVTVAPAAAFFLDDGTEIRSSSSDLTDDTGLVSFTLPPTPDGFFYWWTYPDGTPRPFSVPASGTHWLKDCLTSATLPPGITGLLTKAEADSDYAPIADAALTGTVTLNGEPLEAVSVVDHGDGSASVADTIDVYTKAFADANLARSRGTAAVFDSTALTYPARPAISGPVTWYGPWVPTAAQPDDTWIFQPPATPRRVILDTDAWSDVSDASPIRMLCHAERLGLVDIRAVVIDCPSIKIPGAVSALLDAENRGDLPIGLGTYVPSTGSGANTCWWTVFDTFPHRLGMKSAVTSDVDVYRRALAEAPDGSVDIIGIGYCTSLKALLQSAGDGIDSRTGLQLVTAKVRRLWLDAGIWPTSGSAAENNFGRDSTAAAAGNYVLANWPTPVYLSSFETGVYVILGGNLAGTSATDPLASALNAASYSVGRSGWDTMHTWMAALGDPVSAGYSVSAAGTAVVNASTGASAFTVGAGGKHFYTRRAQRNEWFQTDLNQRLVPGSDPVPTVPPGLVTGLHITSEQRKRAAKTPTQIPARTTSAYTTALVLDLNAADLSDLTVGTKITHWDDRMFYRPARQLTSALCPTLGTPSGNSAHFTGVERLATSTLDWGSSFTVYVRFWLASMPCANQYILAADDSNTSLRIMNIQLSAANVVQAVAFYPNAAGTLATAGTAVAAAWNVAALRVNGASMKCYLGGVAGSAVTLAGQNTGRQALALGSKQIDAQASALTGDISKVRVYSAYHDDATVAAVSTEMA